MSKFTPVTLKSLPSVTEVLSTEEGVKSLDPRLVFLCGEFDRFIARRSDKSSGPGAKAFATKTLSKIVRTVEAMDPTFIGLPEMKSHLTVSSGAKNTALNDLFAEFGIN